MIVIKSVADCWQIENDDHRRLITKLAIEEFFTPEYVRYYELNPDYIDDMSYVVYIQSGDDVTRNIPGLNDSEMGLLCMSNIWSGGRQEPGWCWEEVNHLEDVGLFQIYIQINNELGITYFVPDDEHTNEDLKTALLAAVECKVKQENGGTIQVPVKLTLLKQDT